MYGTVALSSSLLHPSGHHMPIYVYIISVSVCVVGILVAIAVAFLVVAYCKGRRKHRYTPLVDKESGPSTDYGSTSRAPPTSRVEQLRNPLGDSLPCKGTEIGVERGESERDSAVL